MSNLAQQVLRLMSVASLTFTFAACQAPTQGEVSTTQNIATDLPDRIGGGPVNLYWVTADYIFRGTCRVSGPTGTPAIPSNCNQNVRSMRYDQFKAGLDNGLSQTITNLTNEAARIQGVITYVQEQIAQTTIAIAEQERLGGPLTAQLQRLRADLQGFQTFVNELGDQLRLINDELQRLNNDDLMQQREIVTIQLQEYQGRVNDIAARIPQIMNQLQGIEQQLIALRGQLSSLNIRMQNLLTDLSNVNARLQGAVDDFSVYSDTLIKLKSGITYSVLADNVIAARNRQFVRRFEEVFNVNP